MQKKCTSIHECLVRVLPERALSLLYNRDFIKDINKMTVKLITLPVILLLAGCSLMPHILYKIDVQQGNVVTEEMVEKLKPDMTKSQVRFVMGSPLVVDPFRNNRWDYVYIQRLKGDLEEQGRLTIYFTDDRLIRIEKEDIYNRNKKKKKEKNTESESSTPEGEHSELTEPAEESNE